MTRAEFKQHFPAASEDTLRLSCDPEPAPQFITAGPAAEREAELREAIRKEVVSHGWAVFCGTTARATGRTLGECDITVAASGGRTFWIELKTRTGKLSQNQQAVHAHLRKLGHEPHVIRSLEEFRSAVNL